jgi:hypothetical protein
LSEISSRSRKIHEVKVQAAKQNQQAMQYLQMQAQQLQAIQQQIQVSYSLYKYSFDYTFDVFILPYHMILILLCILLFHFLLFNC